jgi:PAS domain-containing protein
MLGNPEFFDYTGLPEQLVYADREGWMQAVHPDDLERAQAMWALARMRLDRYELELRLRGADGAYRTFLGSAHPVRVNGAVVAWSGVVSGVDCASGKRAASDDQKRWTAAGPAAPRND